MNKKMAQFFTISVVLALFLCFFPNSFAVAQTTVVSNGVSITLSGGYPYFFKSIGINSYDEALLITNTNSDQEVSSCSIQYSLLNSNYQVVRSSTATITKEIAPNSSGYASLFNLYNDSSLSPIWAYISLTSANCWLTRAVGRSYTPNGLVAFSLQSDQPNGDAIYTPILFSNNSQTSTSHVLVNVAIASQSGTIVGTSEISGSNQGCFDEITLKPGSTLQCQIVRFNYEPFARFIVKLTPFTLPGDSPTKSASQPGSSPSTDSGLSFIQSLLSQPTPAPSLELLDKDGIDWVYGQDIFGYSCWALANTKTQPQLQVYVSGQWQTKSKGSMKVDKTHCPDKTFSTMVTYHWVVNVYGSTKPNSPHEQTLQVRELLPKNGKYNVKTLDGHYFEKGLFPSRLDQIEAYLSSLTP